MKHRSHIKSISAKLCGLLAATTLVLSPVPAVSAPSLGAVANELANSGLWSVFVSRFVTKQGAVIDNANKGISHSEGQGYGMVLAVAAGDKRNFANIWSFTKKKLQVRGDQLFAWRYRHRSINPVNDKNNATDGDILIAWALLEAHKAGFGDEYKDQGLAILASVKKLFFYHPGFGKMILPGAVGFVDSKRKHEVTINPSYWVMPALERLAILEGDPIWNELLDSGRRVMVHASANRYSLPSDWLKISMRKMSMSPTDKFKYLFGYNSIRIPLYVLWNSKPQRKLALRIIESSQPGRKSATSSGTGMHQVNLVSGRTSGRFSDIGYGAIEALVQCDAYGKKFPSFLMTQLDKNYYPAVLQLLSITALKMRYPQCV